jgi:RNA polymerase sigma-70 factor (ECF subfamily)
MEHRSPLSFALGEGRGRKDLVVSPALEATLEDQVARARLTYPGISLDPLDYARHLGPRLPGKDELLAEVRAVHSGDLFLACACLKTDLTALRALETDLLPKLEPLVKRVEGSAQFVEEVIQRLRDKLLPGSTPKLPATPGVGPS